VSAFPRIASRLIVAALVAGGLMTGLPSPTQATDGNAFVAAANRERVAAGSPSVAVLGAINRIAIERADQLASDRELGHDFDYIRRRLAEEGVCWELAGEIVAQNGSGDVSEFVTQWRNSPPHREIMLNPRYTAAGGSWSRDGSGTAFGAMVFVDVCGSEPSSGFTDISASLFRADIAWLVEAGITAGCAPNRYCPRNAVTREQMASFLRRAAKVPGASRDWFRDDDASAHEVDINRVAEAGIASGCADVKYCPRNNVSRGQMASFLARTLNLPATSRDWFTDDDGTVHEGAINRMAASGITGGCATGRFCAGASVTREQMAAFLHRAFGG